MHKSDNLKEKTKVIFKVEKKAQIIAGQDEVNMFKCKYCDLRYLSDGARRNHISKNHKNTKKDIEEKRDKAISDNDQLIERVKQLEQ